MHTATPMSVDIQATASVPSAVPASAIPVTATPQVLVYHWPGTPGATYAGKNGHIIVVFPRASMREVPWNDVDPAMLDAIREWAADRGWTYVGDCLSRPTTPAAGTRYCSFVPDEDHAGLFWVLIMPLGGGLTFPQLRVNHAGLVLSREPVGWVVILERAPFR